MRKLRYVAHTDDDANSDLNEKFHTLTNALKFVIGEIEDFPHAAFVETHYPDMDDQGLVPEDFLWRITDLETGEEVWKETIDE